MGTFTFLTCFYHINPRGLWGLLAVAFYLDVGTKINGQAAFSHYGQKTAGPLWLIFFLGDSRHTFLLLLFIYPTLFYDFVTVSVVFPIKFPPWLLDVRAFSAWWLKQDFDFISKLIHKVIIIMVNKESIYSLRSFRKILHLDFKIKQKFQNILWNQRLTSAELASFSFVPYVFLF